MKKRVIIIGAGIAGQILERDIKKNHRACEVIGFIDDTRRNGQGYLGSIDDMAAVLDRYKVHEIIIAIPSADGSLIRWILLNNLNNRVPIRIVPREQRVIRHNQVKYEMVRNLNCEDWLGRPPVRSNITSLEKFYMNQVVLVTGGAGSIGSEIVRQLLELKVRQVIVMDNSEFLVYKLEQELREARVDRKKYEIVIGSVTDRERTRKVIKQTRPDVVFHAAAYKHVHLMERCAGEAVKTNVLGTKNAADAAVSARVSKFVLVSTDKAVNPTSIMGATKKIAETYVQSLKQGDTSFNIVRFGNVINSQGSVLPMFNRQVDQRKEVTVTDKRMQRYFMSIREAAQLVIMSVTRTATGAVYVLNMGDLIAMEEVAQCIIRSHNLISGKDIKISVVGRRPGEKMTEELFTKAEKRSIKKTKLSNIWRVQNGREGKRGGDEITNELEHKLHIGEGDREILLYLQKKFPTLDRVKN